jgi:flagellar capping protein FliD
MAENSIAEQISINNELQQQIEAEQQRANRAEYKTAEQVSINNELQQNLEAVQLRANKAEENLAELSKRVSALKDKLIDEQNMFETQFIRLAERHNQFQTEISNCFLNIEDVCII